MLSKNCTKCGALKPLSSYHLNKQSKDGYRGDCKQCQKNIKNAYLHTKKGLIDRIYAKQKERSISRNHPLPSYTKKELTLWMNNQINFDSLYLNWINSGYDKYKRPSCDRLDDYKHYTLNNLRLVTWGENFYRIHKDMKNGINNKQSISVIQFNLSGELIKKFHSQCHAAKCTGVSQGGISACCLGENETAGGFKWESPHD